jgi:hypothetical protein
MPSTPAEHGWVLALYCALPEGRTAPVLVLLHGRVSGRVFIVLGGTRVPSCLSPSVGALGTLDSLLLLRKCKLPLGLVTCN